MLNLTYAQAVFIVDHFPAIVAGAVVSVGVFAVVWRLVVFAVCDLLDRRRPRARE